MNNDTQDLSKSEHGVFALALNSAIPSCEYRTAIVKGMNKEENLLPWHLGDQICVKLTHLDLCLHLSTTIKKSLELTQDLKWVCLPGIKPPKAALTCLIKSFK